MEICFDLQSGPACNPRILSFCEERFPVSQVLHLYWWLYFSFSFADRCNMPLGLADRRIPNPLITASSYHSFYCGPWNARLHQRRVSRLGGSWCARTNNQKQYLQVSDLITCLEHRWIKVVRVGSWIRPWDKSDVSKPRFNGLKLCTVKFSRDLVSRTEHAHQLRQTQWRKFYLVCNTSYKRFPNAIRDALYVSLPNMSSSRKYFLRAFVISTSASKCSLLLIVYSKVR